MLLSRACCGDVFKDVMVFGGHHLLAAVHLLQQGFKPVGMLWTHHQIQFGHATQQDSPSCCATQPATTSVRFGIAAFALRLATEIAVNLLLSVVPDGAGVVEHQIRFEFGTGFLVAHRFEDSGHALGVGLVHLAAEGGDPVAAALSSLGSVDGWGGDDQNAVRTRAIDRRRCRPPGCCVSLVIAADD